MSVYQSPDRVWRYRTVVRLADGSKVRISGTAQINTKMAASEEERRHIERTLNPPAVPLPEKPVAAEFSAFALDWLKKYPAAVNKPSTIQFRSGHVVCHLIPYFGKTPLDRIDNQALIGFLAHLRDRLSRSNTTRKHKPVEPGGAGRKRLSNQTIKNIFQTLHKILACAAEWGVIDRMPKFPKVKVQKAPWAFLEFHEVDALLSAIGDPVERAEILFALKTGARCGEQLALEWDDIDWKNGQIKIRRSVWRGIVGDTKSIQERVVPMAPSLVDALKAIRHLKGRLVFCDLDGRHYTEVHLRAVLRKNLRRAGLKQIRWHDLRHTFASHLVMKGVNLRQVQEWLGHASITMTMRYSHLAKSAAAEQIALLDKPMEQAH